MTLRTDSAHEYPIMSFIIVLINKGFSLYYYIFICIFLLNMKFILKNLGKPLYLLNFDE